jgi:hypothetical protein
MYDREELLYVNGLDAATGSPLIDPVSNEALTQRILEIYVSEQRREDQEAYRWERFAPFDEYDLADPSQAGWGLLVHADEAEAMQDLLAALVEHRNGRVLLYRDEPVRVWKEMHSADAINPQHFPYYVLIAGSPSKIPYELQFSLAVLQAVGRIDFDNRDDYARYARHVVDSETGHAPSPGKRVIFFAPRHPGDYATGQSSQRLVGPILNELPQSVDSDLDFNALIGDEATKANLLAALAADEAGRTPALLFSAGHGVGVQATDPNQPALQGSIVCQDFQSPLTPQQRQGTISGYDVAEGFCLPGGIHFLFACYGAGTRAHSDFARYVPTETRRQRLRNTQGNEDFVAYLPKALLANPQGSTLAVVGHVDPAWVHSFISPVTQERRNYPFGFTLARLLRGAPVGYATMTFSQKYAELSVDLLSLIEDEEESGQLPDPSDFSEMWVCRNDAQNYAIIGDPAVRLRFE